MPKKTIWCLNAATEILGSHVQDILDQFGEDKICFGNRKTFDDPSYTSLNTDNPINLMPGVEYFVPIAPKCLGGRLENPQNEYIQGIAEYYKSLGQNNYKYFWNDDCYKHDYRMVTPQFKGYFDILKDTSPNILIGYSQGGLAAKYLAWLDEKVFSTGYVDSVITISSPNFGSPVANPQNKSYVFKGLLKIAAVFLFDKPIHHLEIHDLIEKKHSEKNILTNQHILSTHAILEEIINKLEEEFGDTFSKLKDLLNTLKNWLGGLNNNPNDAFIDLSITRLYDKYSVLSGINSGSGIYQKGLISSDNKVQDILHPDAAKTIHQVLKKKFLSSNFIINEVDKFKEILSKIDSNNLQLDYKKIEHIYNTEVMVEHFSSEVTDQRIKDRIGNYNNGIVDLNICSNAHDFIIPSSYQLTATDAAISNEYNKVNPNANHLTGSNSVKYNAGKENYEKVLELLGEII